MADISQRQVRQGARAVAANKIRPNGVSSFDYTPPNLQAANNNQKAPIPSTQRGGAPVIQNPTAVDAQTASTLPQNIQDSLQNQSQVKRPQAAEDNKPQVEKQEQDIQNNFGVDQGEEEYLPQEIQNEDEEENISNPDENRIHKPKFPFIMFTVSIFEWMTVLILSLMATVLGVVIFPVGVAIEIALKAWKVFFGAFLIGWSLWYEAREAQTYRNAFKNAKRLKALKPTKQLSRRLFLTVGIVPLVGDVLPLNPYFVISSYLSLKKEFNKNNK